MICNRELLMAINLFSLDASQFALENMLILGLTLPKSPQTWWNLIFQICKSKARWIQSSRKICSKRLSLKHWKKTDLRCVVSSYPADLFFMSKHSDNLSAGTIVIDWVSFSSAEFKVCSDLMLQCRQDLKVKTFFDYEDHAKQSFVQ